MYNKLIIMTERLQQRAECEEDKKALKYLRYYIRGIVKQTELQRESKPCKNKEIKNFINFTIAWFNWKKHSICAFEVFPYYEAQE